MVFSNIYTVAVFLTNAWDKKAHVSFIVSDFEGSKPLANACVCIPEANAYYYTDSSGNTPVIEVPVTQNSYYDGICRRNFGEITVIVYKEGYADYILLNFCVKENQKRLGIKLFLYKKYGGEEGYTSIVETPDGQWIKDLIEKYRKK
jgi:hypothetical protein